MIERSDDDDASERMPESRARRRTSALERRKELAKILVESLSSPLIYVSSCARCRRGGLSSILASSLRARNQSSERSFVISCTRCMPGDLAFLQVVWCRIWFRRPTQSFIESFTDALTPFVVKRKWFARGRGIQHQTLHQSIHQTVWWKVNFARI